MWGTPVFSGTLPRVSARILEQHQAQDARDCWVSSRTVRPIPQLKQVLAGLGADVRTIYRFSPTQWFAWTADVDAVPSPVVGDNVRRTMWTGDGTPKMTTTTIMGAFVGPGVPVSRNLGIPAPENAPNVVLVDQTNDPDTPSEVHAWVYTFVSDLGEEGPPSPPSALLTRGYTSAGAIQPVNITSATGVTGPYGVTTKRIYRTLSGTSGQTSYQLVAETPAVQEVFTDTVLGSALGAGLITTLWDPPPDDLQGLIALPNGVCAGFVDRDVYFSQPYQPHAWPRDYIQTLDYDIVGLGAYGTTLVAGTKGVPYAAVGSDPATLRMIRMELNQACIAKRSFARAAGQGVLYASPEGLILVGPGGAQIVSLPAYDFEGWQALNPQDLQAFYLDGNYVGFLDDGAIAFDQESRSVINYGDNIACGYEDQENDRLYVAIGANIMEWAVVREAGDALRTFRWRGRLETGPARGNQAAQVIADDYPVFLKLIGAGADLMWPAPFDTTVYQVTSSAPFRLPDVFGAHGDWEFEITGSAEVREVRIGAMNEMLA